jgi:hypothetical protein
VIHALRNPCYSLRAGISSSDEDATYIDILLPVMYEIFFRRNCLSDDFTCPQCFVWLTKISHPPLANCSLQSWHRRFAEFCLQRVINVKAFYPSLTQKCNNIFSHELYAWDDAILNFHGNLCQVMKALTTFYEKYKSCSSSLTSFSALHVLSLSDTNSPLREMFSNIPVLLTSIIVP